MNISIKNKFSVIIVFMSILSLLFAYVISNEFISKNLSDKELMKHVFKSGAKGFVKTTVGRRDGSNEIDGTPNLVLLRGREFLAQKLADVPQSSDVDQRNYRIRYFGYGRGGAQEGTKTSPNKIQRQMPLKIAMTAK